MAESPGFKTLTKARIFVLVSSWS